MYGNDPQRLLRVIRRYPNVAPDVKVMAEELLRAHFATLAMAVPGAAPLPAPSLGGGNPPPPPTGRSPEPR